MQGWGSLSHFLHHLFFLLEKLHFPLKKMCTSHPFFSIPPLSFFCNAHLKSWHSNLVYHTVASISLHWKWPIWILPLFSHLPDKGSYHTYLLPSQRYLANMPFVGMWGRDRKSRFAQRWRRLAGRYIVQLCVISVRCWGCKVRLGHTWGSGWCNMQWPPFPEQTQRESCGSLCIFGGVMLRSTFRLV